MPQPRTETRPPSPTGAALVTVDGRSYPLRSAAITARAEGGLALTTLTQEFTNPHQEPLEVVYTMPLPADGAVIGYTIRFGEHVIGAVIEKREVANETYMKALEEGRSAALLEQDRDDTFTQRLGSIPAGESVHVEIQVLHRLDFVPVNDAGAARWEYRFPTVVGVRYQGGADRVTDREQLDVDRAAEGGIPTRIELDLTLADGTPEALAVASSTHDLAVTPEAGAARVRLHAGARLDRDLIVRWNACVEQVGVRCLEGTGLRGDDGRYALLTLTPPSTPGSTLARDVTVLIDASGSMHGSPIQLAKRVVIGLIGSLEERDRFEVIAFANAPVNLTGGLRDASERNREKAIRTVIDLDTGGGTEMTTAMVKALEPLRDGSQRQVVLVTDGEIGFEAEVTGQVMRRLPANARVHTVGVGEAPNRSLTRAVARAGRGVEVFARDEMSATEAATRLCRATVRPVLTELSVDGNGVRGVAPRRPCDVLAGQPLVMALLVDPAGGTVEVSGRQAGTAETWIWRIVLPASGGAAAEAVVPADTRAADARPVLGATSLPLGALYGREAIADLELVVSARDGQRDDLDARIEAAGLRHRVTSRMTSLVAVAEAPSVDPNLPRRRERLPVEVPQGVSAEGTGLFRTTYFGGAAVYRPIRTLRAIPALLSPRTSGVLVRGLNVDWLRRMQRLREQPRSHEPRFSVPHDVKPWVEPVPITVSGAWVLRMSSDNVTVEFEVPFDGFVMPEGEVNAWLDGKTWSVATVQVEESSERGPHPAGFAVRLTLSIVDQPKWRDARSLELRWIFIPTGGRPRQITMTVALPREDTGPR